MSIPAPLGIIAELTHRCPLHCPYCSNPVELVPAGDELNLAQWTDVLVQARHLGIVQAHLSGGEPLARSDLVDIVRRATELGFYTNLITSAFSLDEKRASALAEAGLNHVQISFQTSDREASDQLAGRRAHDRKIAAARIVRALGLPLTLNVVIHRQNIDQIGDIIELADCVGADRLELANVQYYGWALLNRAGLLPTRAQVGRAEEAVRSAVARLRGRLEIAYVASDYHDEYPKPCMGGWGRLQLVVTPDGDVLPCAAAAQITGLPVENIRRSSLESIWRESVMFNRFRGIEWMEEPCRSCDRRFVDYGGCRCQAFLVTGDASATDPVCRHSPYRSVVTELCSQPLRVIPTMGSLAVMPRVGPKRRASPKAKTPPSAATSQ